MRSISSVQTHLPESYEISWRSGNSVNKEFKPTLCEGLDIYDYHMTIYNRWGEIVFETYHFDQGWKGDYSDRGIVEEGIYIWQAEFGEVGSDKRYQLQGHITLLK